MSADGLSARVAMAGVSARPRGAERAVVAAAAMVVGCGHPAPAAPAARCPATGPVDLRGPEDVAAVAGCATLPGLRVATAAPVDLSGLTATTIDGDVVIGPTLAITTVTLPAVTRIRGRLRVAGSGDLTAVFLPALTLVGALEVEGDPSLTSVSAPALVRVTGDLTLARLPALELVDTRALAEVGGALTLAALPALTTWVGPPATVAGPRAIDAPRLDPDTAAALAGPR